jgi:hypothetical protein
MYNVAYQSGVTGRQCRADVRGMSLAQARCIADDLRSEGLHRTILIVRHQ